MLLFKVENLKIKLDKNTQQIELVYTRFTNVGVAVAICCCY